MIFSDDNYILFPSPLDRLAGVSCAEISEDFRPQRRFIFTAFFAGYPNAAFPDKPPDRNFNGGFAYLNIFDTAVKPYFVDAQCVINNAGCCISTDVLTGACRSKCPGVKIADEERRCACCRLCGNIGGTCGCFTGIGQCAQPFRNLLVGGGNGFISQDCCAPPPCPPEIETEYCECTTLDPLDKELAEDVQSGWWKVVAPGSIYQETLLGVSTATFSAFIDRMNEFRLANRLDINLVEFAIEDRAGLPNLVVTDIRLNTNPKYSALFFYCPCYVTNSFFVIFSWLAEAKAGLTPYCKDSISVILTFSKITDCLF